MGVPADDKVKPARERILDAAAMREKGLANTMTKAIAAAAGYARAIAAGVVATVLPALTVTQ